MSIITEKEQIKKDDEKKGFGITEAPKEHPDNTSGTMKVIME